VRTQVFASATADNEDNFAIQDWSLFCLVSVIWGASFLLIAESLDSLTPGMVTLLRVSLGAVTLWVLRLASARGQSLDPQDRGRVAMLGMIWVAIPFTLFPLAQQWVNSAVAGLLNGATPVLVAVVAALFLRVVPKGMQLLGLALGFAGILLISLGSASEGSSEAQGVALIVLATVCYGFAFAIAPPLQAKYGAIVLMSNVLAVATVAVIPFGLVNLDENGWAADSLVAIFILGSVGTGLAYWIMSTLVGRVGSLRSSFITYLIPVISLILGVVLRGDSVTALALVGTPITLAGAFLASRKTADSR
jgi:drug/metabolite transporter (DMT)-like permease